MTSNRTILSGCASAMIATSTLHAQVIQPADPVPAIRPPSVVLNEVLFDELGQDSSSSGEYVELYTNRSINLGNFKLQSLDGSLSWDLPTATIPANKYVLLFLGSEVPMGFNEDPAANSFHVAYAAGIPASDYLSKSSGGVQLLKSGAMIDELYWGVNGVPAGGNATHFVNIAYPSGKAVTPGDTLGRSATAAYTGNGADWDRHGGKNSAGPSPGKKNILGKPDDAGLNHWAQTGLNQIFNGWSFEAFQFDWLKIVNADVSQVVVDDQLNVLTVTGTHTLDVLIDGYPTTLSGQLVASFTRNTAVGNVSYTSAVSGTLTSLDGYYELEVSHSETFSGFQTNATQSTGSTDCVWREFGAEYPYSVSGTAVSSRTGQDTYLFTDNRTSSDWGGAGSKTSSTQTATTETSDGVYASTATITRPVEMGAPPLWQAGQQSISSTATYEIDSTATRSGELGQSLSISITRYDYSTNGQLVLALQSGQTGSFTQQYMMMMVGGDMVMDFDAQMSLPVDMGGSQFTTGLDLMGSTGNYSGKIITQGNYDIIFDGNIAASSGFYADPPGEGGCGCCCCCSCGCQGNQQDKEEGKTVGGFIEAVGTCGGVGAIAEGVGAPIGAGVCGLLYLTGLWFW
jgi:hypothetical protein